MYILLQNKENPEQRLALGIRRLHPTYFQPCTLNMGKKKNQNLGPTQELARLWIKFSNQVFFRE